MFHVEPIKLELKLYNFRAKNVHDSAKALACQIRLLIEPRASRAHSADALTDNKGHGNLHNLDIKFYLWKQN